jgi:anti-anti-sigma factor
MLEAVICADVSAAAMCVALRGEVDLHTVSTLLDAVAEVAHQASPRLVIDLGGVTFMDASGITALIECRSLVQSYGAELEVRGAKGIVAKVLRLADVEVLFSPASAIAP